MRVSVRVCLFSCLAAAVRSASGDFRLPFADASRPFERYALPSVDCATSYSFPVARELHLRSRPLCRCAFWPGFHCSPDSPSWACLRLLRLFLPECYLLQRPDVCVQIRCPPCFHLFPLPLVLPGLDAQISPAPCFPVPVLLLLLPLQVPPRPFLAQRLRVC